MNGWYPMMYPPNRQSIREMIDEWKALDDFLKQKEKKDEKKDDKKPQTIKFEWWEVGIILYALSKPVYLLLDHYHLLPLFQ
jgi:hypothetical protein